ncbi:hypothetical protein GVN16_24225 [Emticicia sp. CRIBPO]|uniref:HNH endonuclease domain-containing protein n=1 Tax=Emticicia sp. CRIBPO TaxID=2683258 RepID=UPI001412E89A|nr:HNH endonuclease domain-containing protein [Emticicia sp. CRIBPO]NBA88904.1 hypothetical protein [Emticicia sp. CRIBPO]
MTTETFSNISKIIERDSKFTTYKFALLRGVIDIIQDNSPYIVVKENEVEIPLGLLIEKWLIYYYPLFESELYIPQINGKNSRNAFHEQLKQIIEFYKLRGGISVFYNEIRTKNISFEINQHFFILTRKIKDTITQMPMRYIGGSISEGEYPIFKYRAGKPVRNTTQQNLHWMIKSFGYFTIPKEYYEAFKILGGFLAGRDNILFKWAEFSVGASKISARKQKLSTEKALHEMLKGPITEREISNSKSHYKDLIKSNGQVHCVWTGETISKYDIDHIIPFSIFKNNDLWNLLPAKPAINNRKRDKIPSPEALNRAKDLIIHYWELICLKQQDTFLDQVQISLLGNLPKDNWQIDSFEQLVNTSKYLIGVRGYEGWRI